MADAGAGRPGGGDVAAAVAAAHRRDWALVLAATARVARDLDLAQECVQDAYVAALDTWSRRGVPDNPAAWLTTVARNKALDARRRDQVMAARLPLVVPPPPDPPAGPDAIPDDRLRLVFTCCHPALARTAQVALTLRLVCGLSTAEIAAAFLVSEATMAARVTRAKKKISAARIPYRVPPEPELPDRLDAVLTVIHLVFTTGHTAPAGTGLTRPELTGRAAGLARMVCELMPDEREARGLLALVLLTSAREAARLDGDGRLVLLEDQDRSRWDQAVMAEGLALVPGALRGGRPGRFALQAAIAAVHAAAPSWADTDWAELVGLYDLLLVAWPSPVVALNRAVAVALADGPAAGLTELDRLADDPRLAGYHYLPAARADLLRRQGASTEAAAAYAAALALAGNEAERAFLARRLAEVSSNTGASD